MENCKVEGCQSPLYVKSKGLCSRHYNRLRTTGTTDDGSRPRASLEERLWKQIDRRGRDECWPWSAMSKIDGYGVIGRGGRDAGKILAHRAAWESMNGPIPSGEGYHGTVVLHTCDNRLCCNPAHLRLGTQADNVRDMDAKGRRVAVLRYGEDHHMTKITEDDVRAIRSSTERAGIVAARYGLDRHTIASIRARRTWKHVT